MTGTEKTQEPLRAILRHQGISNPPGLSEWLCEDVRASESEGIAMTYHYSDIEPEWLNAGDGVLGWDLPVLLSGEYTQAIMLATMALNIGYAIGCQECRHSALNSAETD